VNPNIPPSIRYRPEIDGLRALAVLAVVVFHAKLGLLPGGFAGVDVFFTISGFLITSIIVKEETAGHFSIVQFYERRVRRIFPALFVVVAFTYIVGAFLFIPTDYLALTRSGLGAILFYSNLLFANKAGYFAAASETQPLLHTWSLGVEEQFYIAAPLVLLLLYRKFPRFKAPVIALLFGASLAVSVYGVETASRSVFYMPHTRAFELLVGVILAMGLVPPASSDRLRQGLGWFGLSLIAVAFLFFSNETPFPGLHALVPTLGAGLILYSTQNGETGVSRLLSVPAMVGVGKISYSLYLWHWPLLAFAEYEFGAMLTFSHRFALIGLAILLSVLTYRYVEQPVRQASLFPSRRRVFAASLIALAICGVVSHAVELTAGMPGRLPASVQALIKVTPLVQEAHCLSAPPRSNRDAARVCEMGARSQKPHSFIFMGDSHAMSLAPSLDRAASQSGMRGYSALGNGCLQFFGLVSQSDRLKHCSPLMKEAEAILARPEIKDVILMHRWGFYAEGEKSPNEDMPRFDRTFEGNQQAIRAAFTKQFLSTLSTLLAAGKRVTILGPVPEMHVDVPRAFLKAAMRGVSQDIMLERHYFDTRQKTVFAAFEQAKAMNNLRIIALHERLCSDKSCLATRDGRALYIDDDHLSPTGIALLEKDLNDLVQGFAR
jgi:peptidoglycan/LPS O-acetylase OafA/YrhL